MTNRFSLGLSLRIDERREVIAALAVVSYLFYLLPVLNLLMNHLLVPLALPGCNAPHSLLNLLFLALYPLLQLLPQLCDARLRKYSGMK